MANFNFNKVILAGRLTADPELRQTSQGTAVTSFTIAVNRAYTRSSDGQQTADFINCVAWRSNAEFITKYFRKDSSICVCGSIQTRNWTDSQTGQKRYATEVVVDETSFVDSKSEAPAASYGTAPAAAAPTTMTVPAFASETDEAAKFEELSSDDDLPF